MKKLVGKPDRARLISGVIAGVLLVAAIFLPLWRMELVAPQYPEGLVMYAYGDHFQGGTEGYYASFDAVKEINALNHYIGMRPIEEVFAMKLFIPGLILTAVGGITASFIAWRPRWFHGFMAAVFWFIPIFFLGMLQYNLYVYGHTMDEDAALAMDSFTPRVIGGTSVWNFNTENSLQIGFFLMVLSALSITFMPMAIRRAQTWRQRKANVTESTAGSPPERQAGSREGGLTNAIPPRLGPRAPGNPVSHGWPGRGRRA